MPDSASPSCGRKMTWLKVPHWLLTLNSSETAWYVHFQHPGLTRAISAQRAWVIPCLIRRLGTARACLKPRPGTSIGQLVLLTSSACKKSQIPSRLAKPRRWPVRGSSRLKRQTACRSALSLCPRCSGHGEGVVQMLDWAHGDLLRHWN